MKNLMKLIPGIALLLLSAILLSTATYAWFSMNATVYAKNMQIEAVSDGSLYINNAAEEPTYSAIVDGTVSWVTAAAQLRPTSTTDLANWYYAPAEFATNYSKADSTNFSPIPSNNNEGYYLKKTVWIRSEKDFQKLVVSGVSINATKDTNGTADDLKGAITVAFKVHHYTNLSEQKTNLSQDPVFICNEATDARHGGVTQGASSQPAVDTLTFVPATSVGTGNEQATQVIWNKGTSSQSVANFVFQVDIFLYFDGQSNSCYSNALLNAITLNAIIDVAFATELN